jgi:hypothetical protein
MKKKVNWQIVEIVIINWGVFAMILACLSIYYLLNEVKEITIEKDECAYQFELFNQKIKEGEIRIVLEKSDLTK